MMDWLSENLNTILELIGLVGGISYVLLVARNKSIGWIIGGIGSIAHVTLFWRINLKAESILYFYYIIASIQGYLNWNKQGDLTEVYQRNIKFHGALISLGIALSLGLYFVLQQIFPDADKPMIDSFTTMFSFIATWLVVKKEITNWIYWIIIDLISVWLYWTKGVEYSAGLMAVFTVLAVFGYLQWKKLKVVQQ